LSADPAVVALLVLPRLAAPSAEVGTVLVDIPVEAAVHILAVLDNLPAHLLMGPQNQVVDMAGSHQLDNLGSSEDLLGSQLVLYMEAEQLPSCATNKQTIQN